MLFMICEYVNVDLAMHDAWNLLEYWESNKMKIHLIIIETRKIKPRRTQYTQLMGMGEKVRAESDDCILQINWRAKHSSKLSSRRRRRKKKEENTSNAKRIVWSHTLSYRYSKQLERKQILLVWERCALTQFLC